MSAWNNSSWSDGGCIDGTCEGGTCGTGGWTGPYPGDPDNYATLSAVGDYGGVKVSWSYPTTNAFAVAHTKLYRGTSSDFSLAVEHRIVAGSYFFDAIPEVEIRQYYYWIKFVSVNGTDGDLIGYATATPLSLTLQTLESLSGLIDEGVLAQSLRTRIAKLDILNRDLGAEIIDRISNNEALVATLAQVQSDSELALTYIGNEITNRTSADEALVNSIQAIAAGLAGNAAAIVEEQTVRVDAIEALASDVSILYTDFATNTAAIIDERTARTTATEALSRSLNILATENDSFGAAIQNEAQARVNGDSSLANQIATAQSVMGNNLASVQTTMETKITTTNGKVTDIGALYNAKVDVNGLVGGFGVYNDGRTIEAGFDVDKFFIGRYGVKQKPFVVSDGTVFINEARVNTLSIAGNAVTVPISGNQSGAAYGNGSYQQICNVTVSNAGNSSSMGVFVTCGGLSSYAVGIRTVSFKLVHEGVGILREASGVSGDYVTTPMLSGYSTIAPNGWATFTFYWRGADSTVTCNQCQIIAIGTKR